MKKAVVLLSGGLDSSVCAAIAIQHRYRISAISFDYGQKHIAELLYAKSIAEKICEDHLIVVVPRIVSKEGNYFPARNTIFLSLALSYCETIEAKDIFIGVNADDTFFPDCSPSFIKSFENTARLGTKQGGITIHAPLIKMSKVEIIKTGQSLNVDFSKTLTCYNGTNCGKCDSCTLRVKSFKEASLTDPIIYA